jgi:hypothetical protein
MNPASSAKRNGIIQAFSEARYYRYYEHLIRLAKITLDWMI